MGWVEVHHSTVERRKMALVNKDLALKQDVGGGGTTTKKKKEEDELYNLAQLVAASETVKSTFSDPLALNKAIMETNYRNPLAVPKQIGEGYTLADAMNDARESKAPAMGSTLQEKIAEGLTESKKTANANASTEASNTFEPKISSLEDLKKIATDISKGNTSALPTVSQMVKSLNPIGQGVLGGNLGGKSETETDEVEPEGEVSEVIEPEGGKEVVNAGGKALVDTVPVRTPIAYSGGDFQNALVNTLNQIEDRKPFNYDINGDALYQQYKDQYISNGNLAMMDTIGQASAMTGGYGNSYAQTAGNQAYQGYLQQLNDRIPELYKLAYDQYNDEGNALNSKVNTYRNLIDDWNAQNVPKATASQNESIKEKAYDYSTYSKVEADASSYEGDDDALYNYLMMAVQNGWISQDTMDLLYEKYRTSKSTVNTHDGGGRRI